MNMKYTASLFAALTLGLAAATAAPIIAYNENAVADSNLAGYGASGFNFKAGSVIQITDLGFFAISIGGGDAPTVALWNVTTNTQLAVTPNLISGIAPGWNYYTLAAPITLNTTDTYQVLAPIYWTPSYISTAGFTYGAAITSPVFVNSGAGWGGWTQPGAPVANVESGPFATGANFKYDAIPEPSTYALLLMDGGGVLLYRRRVRG